MKLERFVHLVLTVRSIAATSVFYRDVLGMEVVTFGEGRIALCTPDLIAFGTVAHFVEGIERVTEQQWRRVWPNIRDFTIRTAAAPWDSLGVRPDGTTFSQPGRLTTAFEKRDGRGLGRHTHFSLSPAPA